MFCSNRKGLWCTQLYQALDHSAPGSLYPLYSTFKSAFSLKFETRMNP